MATLYKQQEENKPELLSFSARSRKRDIFKHIHLAVIGFAHPDVSSVLPPHRPPSENESLRGSSLGVLCLRADLFIYLTIQEGKQSSSSDNWGEGGGGGTHTGHVEDASRLQ